MTCEVASEGEVVFLPARIYFPSLPHAKRNETGETQSVDRSKRVLEGETRRLMSISH